MMNALDWFLVSLSGLLLIILLAVAAWFIHFAANFWNP